jgi:hypothetical protein
MESFEPSIYEATLILTRSILHRDVSARSRGVHVV